ncbi:MAG: hypothetical protein WD342_03990 [Verrucomicrobiales bacterium]
MKSSFDSYTRVAKGLFGMSSLWTGKDHLVYVRGSGILLPFSEEYRRYRYEDIQAFSVVKTSRLGKGILYGIALLFVGGLLALMLAVGGGGSIGIVFAVLASVLSLAGLGLLALLLRHLILGPTCLCDIQTGLSKARIRPLDRYHRAKEAIDRIGARVRESQRDLPVDDAEGGTAESKNAASTAISEPFGVPGVVRPTFGVFLVAGLACLASLHLESPVLVAGTMAVVFAASMLLLLSLVASVRRATPESIRTILWSLLGMLFLLVGIATVYFLVAATRNSAYTMGIVGPLEALAALAVEGGVVLYLVFLGLGAGLFIGALVGLIESTRWSRQIGQAEVGLGLAGAGSEKAGIREKSDE